MTPKDAYLRIKALRDGRQAVINSTRQKSGLTARERNHTVGEAMDDRIALEMALQTMARHLSGPELLEVEHDEERSVRSYDRLRTGDPDFDRNVSPRGGL